MTPIRPHMAFDGEHLRPDERSSLHASSLAAMLHLATLTAAVRSGVRLAVRPEVGGYKISAMSANRRRRPLVHNLTLGQAVAWLDSYQGPTQ